jgi:hypothetical protein
LKSAPPVSSNRLDMSSPSFRERRWLRDPRREAAAVLQGTRPAGAKSPPLDSALIEEVAKALSLIRGALPDLAGAISDADPSALRISLRPAAGRRVRRLGQFLPNRSV